MVRYLLHCPSMVADCWRNFNKNSSNAAARIVTGYRQRVSIDYFHVETQLIRIDQSLGLLCSQYLASALRTSHPSSFSNSLPTTIINNQKTNPQSSILIGSEPLPH